MKTKQTQKQKSTDKPAAAVLNDDGTTENSQETKSERSAGRVRADQKRNDEAQYHAGGMPHDPRNRTQERVDRRDPDAGDLDKVSEEQEAPFNKTYGHHA